MDIFAKIHTLDLPKDNYVIVGAALLVVLGLIPSDDDIDLAVTPELFEKLKSAGWQQQAGWGGKPVLQHDVYDVGVGFGAWSLEDLQTDALVINGVPFISLAKLRAWKAAANRPKDLPHIAAIDTYLSAQSARE